MDMQKTVKLMSLCIAFFIVFFVLTVRVEAAFGSAEADSLFGTYPETTGGFMAVNVQAVSQHTLTREINHHLSQNSTTKFLGTDAAFWQRAEKTGLTPKSVPYFYMIHKSKYESLAAPDMVAFVRTDLSPKDLAEKIASVLAPVLDEPPLDIRIEKDTQGVYFYKVVNNANFERNLTKNRMCIQFKRAPQPGFIMISLTATSFDWLKTPAPKTKPIANTNWRTTRGTFDENTLCLTVHCTRRQQMILSVTQADKQTIAAARYRMETPDDADKALSSSNEEMPSILAEFVLPFLTEIKPKLKFSRYNTHTIEVQEVISDSELKQIYTPAILKAQRRPL